MKRAFIFLILLSLDGQANKISTGQCLQDRFVTKFKN